VKNSSTSSRTTSQIKINSFFVPDGDRDKGNACYVLPVVMQMAEDGFCCIRTCYSVLKQPYSNSHFPPCRTKSLRFIPIQGDKGM
jgi:hypothetical protein